MTINLHRPINIFNMPLIILISKAPQSAGEKPSTKKLGTKNDVSFNIIALMMNVNRPTDKILIGNVKIIKTGRTSTLSSPSTPAAITTVIKQ